MPKIAIFDMDGTLIDSGQDITISINYVRHLRYGLKPLDTQSVIDAINAPSRNLSQIFYGIDVYEEDARHLFEKHYYDQCIQNVTYYDGIPDLLERLRLQNIAMGVATNAPTIFAKRMLKHLHLDSYFDLIIGADAVEMPKPHPEMIQKHLELHCYESGTDNAWMVGDNSKDMHAAKNAGIRSIFATWGFSREGDGDHCVASPEEVLHIILGQEG